MLWKVFQKHYEILVISVLILLILFIDAFFRHELFLNSLDMIVYFQTELPSFAEIIFQIITTLGDPNVILPVYFIVLACQINKFFLVKLGIFICFIAYFLCLVKLIYEGPRPYWFRPYLEGLPGYGPNAIHPLQGYAEFGNPSGHVFFVVSFFGYLFYVFVVNHHKKVFWSKRAAEGYLFEEELTEHLIQDKNVNLPSEEAAGFSYKPTPPMSKPLFVIVNTCCIIVLLLLCFSRMYLGMHTLNQILLSLGLGSVILYIFIVFVDQRLEEFLKTIAKQELSNKSLTIWIYSVLYVIASIIPILIFLKTYASNPVASSVIWTEWWVVAQREVQARPTSFAHIRCFLDSGIVGGFFGIILGALSSNGSYTETAPELNTIPKFKIALRVLVLLIAVAFPATLLSIIAIPVENYILQYFIHWNLALFTAGFAATNLVPILYAKLGLDIEGDFLRLKTPFIPNENVRP